MIEKDFVINNFLDRIEKLESRVWEVEKTAWTGEAVESADDGTLNVKTFGAVGNGATDDTVAIQAAIDALHSTYGTYGTYHTLYFPRGNYLVSDTISAKTLYRCYITGDAAQIYTKAGSDFGGKAVINLSGSSYTVIRGIEFASTLSADTPTAVILYGRNSGGSGGDIHFEDCVIGGNCTVASLLFAHGDTSSFTRCRIYSSGSTPALLMTSYNDSGLLDYTESTATLCRFSNCFIFASDAACSKVIVMQGLIQRTIFDTCFIYLPTDTIAVSVEDSAGASLNEIAQLTFINSSIEGGGTDSLWIYVHNTNGLSGLSIIGGSWSEASSYVINVDSLVSDRGLWYAFIPTQIGLGNPTTTKLIHLTAGVVQFSLITCGSEDIDTESGTTLSKNSIHHIGGDYSLGSGTFENNYIQGYNGDVSVGVMGYDAYAVPDESTAPYVLGGVMVFSNSVATTVSNMYKKNTGNSIVHCVFTNSNTTMNAGGYFKLKGGVNWNPPSGATLTLLYYSGYWYEIGRMDPT